MSAVEKDTKSSSKRKRDNAANERNRKELEAEVLRGEQRMAVNERLRAQSTYAQWIEKSLQTDFTHSIGAGDLLECVVQSVTDELLPKRCPACPSNADVTFTDT